MHDLGDGGAPMFIRILNGCQMPERLNSFLPIGDYQRISDGSKKHSQRKRIVVTQYYAN